jgi:transcriptional regulator of arginine metabolism
MSTAKQDRQATILEVVSSHVVDSQEVLRRLLRQRGWDVTQATLSRDLRELRLVRVPTADGPRYAPAGGTTPDAGKRPRSRGSCRASSSASTGSASCSS